MAKGRENFRPLLKTLSFFEAPCTLGQVSFGSGFLPVFHKNKDLGVLFKKTRQLCTQPQATQKKHTTELSPAGLLEPRI